jgi:hypothetical protein
VNAYIASRWKTVTRAIRHPTRPICDPRFQSNLPSLQSFLIHMPRGRSGLMRVQLPTSEP